MAGWPESDNMTSSVQLNLTRTGPGTKLGKSKNTVKVIVTKKTLKLFIKFFFLKLSLRLISYSKIFNKI